MSDEGLDNWTVVMVWTCQTHEAPAMDSVSCPYCEIQRLRAALECIMDSSVLNGEDVSYLIARQALNAEVGDDRA